MSDDWADEVAEAPPTELAPVLPELPQIMLFGERQMKAIFDCKHGFLRSLGHPSKMNLAQASGAARTSLSLTCLSRLTL